MPPAAYCPRTAIAATRSGAGGAIARSTLTFSLRSSSAPDPTGGSIASTRKLFPATYDLAHDGWLPERFALVGIARDELSGPGDGQVGLVAGSAATAQRSTSLSCTHTGGPSSRALSTR